MHTQGTYATQDITGMCHLMPQRHLPVWREEDEQAFVHRGIWISNKDLDNTICQPLSTAFARSHYKVTDDTLESSVADADVYSMV